MQREAREAGLSEENTSEDQSWGDENRTESRWRKMVQDGSCKGFRVLKACFYAALYGRHKAGLPSLKSQSYPMFIAAYSQQPRGGSKPSAHNG